MQNEIEKLQGEYQHSSAQEVLDAFLRRYKGRIALASSLGAEDQVLTDMVLKIDPAARIFVLDTGRLHQETYRALSATMAKYGMRYEVYFPQTSSVEAMVHEYGPDLFYESIENRKNCCQVRKLEPLRRVLKTLDVWITGLRREQSVTRTQIETIEWDETNGLIKLSPLADWDTERVWGYIRENDVPYNQLHDLGFPSIGCAPCTRAVGPGEDLRSGRWWWEEPEQKECGLHYHDGKLLRGRAT